MIVDHIENLERLMPYIKDETLIRGLKYLKETDMNDMSAGRHVIDGDNMFVIVSEYETKERAAARPEAHIKYIDIQYIIKGEEVIANSRLVPGLFVTEDKLSEKDVIFYNVDAGETDVLMQQGMFAVLFPWDVHRPSCTYKNPAQMKKAVVKIKII
jgi:YhcH/YjgK/YiaL family protein